ncbi:MAG: response regulator transcription factor [Acidobacteriia bacterium]|nr:response regulator transcription factor [Terriglobia bacterium]
MEEKVLIVEDEAGLVTTLRDRLHGEGYHVEVAQDGIEGLKRGSEESFDLVILDVMLPRKSGFDVCRDLRQRGVGTPIIMLTAREQTVDKVVGLRLGADDYLTKPFDMLELLARIEALLRRAPGTPIAFANTYKFGAVRVDFRRTEVFRDGEQIPLSAKEFQLLRYLIEHRGTTLSRRELLQEVWAYRGAGATRTLDVHIAWLRQKLEEDPKKPKLIITVPGLGYRFEG